MGYALSLILHFSQLFTMGAGMYLAFSLGGIMYLGFPMIVTISSYALAIALQSHVTSSAALGITLAVAVACAGVMNYFYTSLSPDAFLTLGFAGMAAVSSIALSWIPVTNGSLGITGIPRPALVDSLASLTLASALWAAAIAVALLVLISSPFGRRLRGFKVSTHLLESLGISSRRIATISITVGTLLFACGAVSMVWHTQFVTPDIGSMSLLIEVITVSILSLKPNIFRLILSTFFVSLIPEVLRFIQIPSAIMGNARLIIYSVLLLVLLYIFRTQLTTNTRNL